VTAGGGSRRFSGSSKKPKKKIAVIVGGAAGLILIAGLVTTWLMGLWYVGVKAPSEKIVVRQTACDNLIDDYTKAAAGSVFNPADEMKKLAAQIPANSSSDINCQYIKLYAAYNSGDQQAAENLAKTVTSLANQNGAVDERLPVTTGVNILLNNSGTEMKGNSGNGEESVSRPTTSAPAPTAATLD